MNYLLENTNAHFVFLPHCIGPTVNNDDRIMNRDIYERLDSGKDRISLIENEYSAGELKGLLKSFEFVLGERTHGLIGSLSVATPCIALTVEEDSRMHNIVNRMFHQTTINLNEPDLDEIKNILLTGWKNRQETAIKMQEFADKAHEDAYKSANLLKDRIQNPLNR